MNILSNLQHFLIALKIAVTTAIMAVFPILTPTVEHTQVKIIQPNTVLGANQKNVNESRSESELIRIVYTPTPTVTPTPTSTLVLTPTFTPSPTPTPTAIPTQTVYTNTPLPNTFSPPQNKPDYSSYRLALENTLNSLRSRLVAVRASADNVPQSVSDDIAVIDMKINAIRENENTAVQRQTVTTANELGRRGILPNSGLGQQEIVNAVNPIIQQFEGMVKDLEYQKQDVKNAAIAKVYQFANQDKDLNGKISVIEGLINKISSGVFTDSDIPLAIQATYY